MGMVDFKSNALLVSDMVAVWDVLCPGLHTKSAEETTDKTHIVFPYDGLYVHHLGHDEAVADSSRVLFLNQDQVWRMSHPVAGGDSSLSIGLSPEVLVELVPGELLAPGDVAALNRSDLRVDTRTQAMAANVRHRLDRGAISGVLEAETVTMALVRAAVRGHALDDRRITARSRKIVDAAKVVVGGDLGRRWTLSDVATEVGVSPVYLTQVFQRVEGIPMYRYQLQLRLAQALQRLGEYDDVTDLAIDLGFSSHSHFSAAFKQTYGQTPSQFRRSSGVHRR
ncbi:helix-turn-helix transcriptional regulator [Mycolicibacterium stellerae]|uniref:helix-turn-helix transcriptional regulator n=1 Tax=Mycolicibacterium stellerae TaxID=2358193 RepID=UPI0019D15621|nr:AraC family transcriptional regulator [Mycolicibacterium stellerae]